MEFILIFTIIYGIVPFILYLIVKKKNRDLHLILPFLIVVFLASVYELIGTVILKISVEYWYLVYKTLAFIGLHYYFYILLNKKHISLFFIYILGFITLLFLFLTVLKDIIYLEISAYFNMFQTLIVLTFSILWFRRLFIKLDEEDLTKNPNFYFVSGFIICYCGTVFLFLMSSSLYAQDKSNFHYYWLLNILLNFILRSLLIIGVWKARVK
jgi:hypothetical protein